MHVPGREDRARRAAGGRRGAEILKETGLWVRATMAMLDGVFDRLGDGRDLMIM